MSDSDPRLVGSIVFMSSTMLTSIVLNIAEWKLGPLFMFLPRRTWCGACCIRIRTRCWFILP